MVKQISCATSCCGNRYKAHNTCLVNIIRLVAEIIPDNWRCFYSWYQVFVFSDFPCSFFNVVTSDSLHVQGRGLLWHTEQELMIGGSLCMQGLHAQCVLGTLEIRWVNSYCAHVPCDDNAQTIYRASLVSSFKTDTVQISFNFVMHCFSCLSSLSWSSFH